MVVRRTISDGFDMVFRQPAIELSPRRTIWVAWLLMIFATVWIALGILAISAATAVFPPHPEGLAVDILQIIFEAWLLPFFGLAEMFVAILAKFSIGRFAVAIEGDA